MENKYRDNQVQAAASTAASVRDEDMPFFLKTSTSKALRLAGSLGRVMSQEAQERAFGAPGVPGDPAWIEHLARSWNGRYGGFLDWSAELRGTHVSAEWHDVLDALAHYADQPIRAYREFVTDFVASVDDLPRALGQRRRHQDQYDLDLGHT